MSDTAESPGVIDVVRDWADAVQQRHTVLGFPIAVVKKYGDDGGARHAAMLTYYGFLSIFPVLLLVVLGLTRLLVDNPELRADVIDAIVPDQFRETVDAAVQTLPTGGLPLVVGLVALLFSSLGVVFSAYVTLNALANVPHRRRLGFFPRYLRIVAMLVLLLIGIVGIGALTVVAGSLYGLPELSRVAAFSGTAALLFLLLWASVQLLLPQSARLAIIWPAAVIGALVVAAVLTFGALVLPGFVARSGAVYGSFATIVGLFTLLLIVGQAVIIAAEVAVVRHRRLWPRGLNPLAPTDADRKALTLLAREQERTPIERVDTRFDGAAD